MFEIDKNGRTMAFEKAKRLGAKAGENEKFWNWAVQLSKRELIELILCGRSVEHVAADYRRLKREKRI